MGAWQLPQCRELTVDSKQHQAPAWQSGPFARAASQLQIASAACRKPLRHYCRPFNKGIQEHARCASISVFFTNAQACDLAYLPRALPRSILNMHHHRAGSGHCHAK